MHRPDSGIVSVKGDGDLRAWRNRESIAQCSGYLLAVNLYNLESCPCKCIGCPMLVELVNAIPTRSPVLISSELLLG